MQGSNWPGSNRYPQSPFNNNTQATPRGRIPPASDNKGQTDEGTRASLQTQAKIAPDKFHRPIDLNEARIRAQMVLPGAKTSELTRRPMGQAQPLGGPGQSPAPSKSPSLAVRVRACCVDPKEGVFDLSGMNVDAVNESEMGAVRRIGPFALQLTLPTGLKALPRLAACFTDLETITIQDFQGDRLDLCEFPLLREISVSGPRLRRLVLPERSVLRICPGQLPEGGVECVWKMNDDGREVAKETRRHPWIDARQTSAYIDAMREDLKKLTRPEDVVRFLRAEIPCFGESRSAFDMLAHANAEALPLYLDLIRTAIDDNKLPITSVPEVLARKESTGALLLLGKDRQQRDQAAQAYEKSLLQMKMSGCLSEEGVKDLMKRLKPA